MAETMMRPSNIRGARLGIGFGLSLADLFSPPLLSILAITVVLNIALLLAIWFGVGYALTETTFFSSGWLEWLADLASGFGTVVVTVILFPALATIILSMFLDSAAAKVARRHYPWLPEGRDQPFGEMLGETLRFLVVMIVANLIVLPIYLLLPAVNLVVFLLLNGYLLGREYFEMIAVRYVPGREARRLRARHRFSILSGGILIALAMMIPIVNLVAPLWAVALMVHVNAGILPSGKQADS